MTRSLREISEAVQARLQGDGNLRVAGVASIVAATAADLVFVEDQKYLSDALHSQAAAVIAPEFAVSVQSSKPLLISEHPKLAFARAAQVLNSLSARSQATAVHPTAVVDRSARLGAGVSVGPDVVIEEDAEIGANTKISAGCVIAGGVKVGNDCVIYPRVTMYRGTTIGNRVIMHAGAVLGSDGFGYVRNKKTGHYEKFPQVGRLIIEDDVEIGANSTIDRGALDETRIGRGTKIDNLVHIGHNCQIGEDVVIAAQTGLSGSITIKNGVVLGGQVGIGEHACLEEGVMLGGQGGVLPHKILRGKGVAFWGTPAQPVREYLKQLATLAKLSEKAK